MAADGAQDRGNRAAGRDPVVNHDHRAALRAQGRPPAAIDFPAPLDLGKLPVLLGLNLGGVGIGL